jgi:hypothetical protein
MEPQKLDTALAGSDSDSDDVLKPGEIQVTVRNNGDHKSIIMESTDFSGVCRLPLEKTSPNPQYSCALTSAQGVFAGEFETRCDLVAAVSAFAETAASGSKTAASGSKTSTASIKRLLM